MYRFGPHRYFTGIRKTLELGITVVVLGVTTLISPGSRVAAATNEILVIGNDSGGNVQERAELIAQYKTSGVRVEIRGDYCLSACTMFLGLDNTCITPTTRFGFHGPGSPLYGIALSPVLFERWSQVMADNYPEPLRTWFLQQGRNRTVGFYEYSGSQLINMGITPCVG